MTQYQSFRRSPVPQQIAQQMQTTMLAAPTRGLIESENYAFMQPGGAVVLDNWAPTMRGVKLRGGSIRWCDLHSLDAPAWVHSHAYTIGNTAYDASDGSFWNVAVAHTSPGGTSSFSDYRTAQPTHWVANTTIERAPIVSAFEYSSGNTQRMFAGQATKLFDVTFSTPTLVKAGQTSGNYCASQLANAGGDWMLVLNDAGDPPLRYNGSSWTVLNGAAITNWVISHSYAVGATAKDPADNTLWRNTTLHTSGTGTFAADRAAHPGFWVSTAADGLSWITGPPGSTVQYGSNLTYVCKYRNRWFFVEGGTMNAWYLGIDSVGGALSMIPLSGAATKGGKLLFCATWSIDAGDGIDDKLVFCTNHGELLIFTGSDPSDASNWRQEGRYQMPAPMGMNAHIPIGGDLLIATVEGIVPVSAAITKTSGDLDLAMITKNIKSTWRNEVTTKNAMPWTMERWDEYGAMFVTFPGGKPGKRYCGIVNTGTGAWGRFTGWDCTCYIRMRSDMFFGTQDGIVMQADRNGTDDGAAYTAIMVGGWEMFQSPSQTVVWRQARANFTSKSNANFNPQVSACTDYVVNVPPPPPPAQDPGVLDVWDQGLWDEALWDQDVPAFAVVRNTGWVSVGLTGYSHAPVIQVTMHQQAKPDVELISISATYERCGVNV